MRASIVRFVATSAVLVLVASTEVAHADGVAGKTPPASTALTAQQVDAVAAKRQAEAQFMLGAVAPQGPGFGVTASPDATCGARCGGGGYPSSASFAGNQTPQITSYYCGPATVHEALNSVGVGMSQQTAADHLNTTTAGTAWSGGGTSPSGYPVPDVLNHHETRNYYVPQSVPSDGPSAVDQYEQDLTYDIYAVGAPTVGDAYEVPGGAHLNGHPKDRQILHWFDIRGYTDSGASTMYEDSVHSATSVTWYAGVPAYSTLSSSRIVTLVEGRGYIW
jgi:hypothetical protein